MGAAATQRGDKSIARGLYASQVEARNIDDMVLALEVSEECNAFERSALAYLNEPRGLRQPSVDAAKLRRGWKPRMNRLIAAHCNWVDTPINNVALYHQACTERGQAAFKLLTFALGTWTIPSNIVAPRAVRS